jgi:hypothetical protein
MTASYVDEILAWIQPALRHYADSFQLEPDLSEDDRIIFFLGQLGLGAAHEHPVVSELLEHLHTLDTDQRPGFLAEEAEAFVHGAAHRSVTSMQPNQDHTNEQAVRQLADEAYHWVVQQLTAEDPRFPDQLAADPELAQAIYNEALQRFGTLTAGSNL